MRYLAGLMAGHLSGPLDARPGSGQPSGYEGRVERPCLFVPKNLLL